MIIGKHFINIHDVIDFLWGFCEIIGIYQQAEKSFLILDYFSSLTLWNAIKDHEMYIEDHSKALQITF